MGNRTRWSAPLDVAYSQCAAQSIAVKQNISVGKEQPLPSSMLRGQGHGVCLAQPAGRKFAYMQNLQGLSW